MAFSSFSLLALHEQADEADAEADEADTEADEADTEADAKADKADDSATRLVAQFIRLALCSHVSRSVHWL